MNSGFGLIQMALFAGFAGFSLYLWRTTAARGAVWLALAGCMLIVFVLFLELAPNLVGRLMEHPAGQVVVTNFLWLCAVPALFGYGLLVRSMRQLAPRLRPINSSKPTPLRGAA